MIWIRIFIEYVAIDSLALQRYAFIRIVLSHKTVNFDFSTEKTKISLTNGNELATGDHPPDEMKSQ